MVSLTSTAVVAAVAVFVPLAIRFLRLPVPDAVGLLLVGTVMGPGVLGWARPDPSVDVLSMVGLAFLLLLAGLEIDVRRLSATVVVRALWAFALSFAIALAVGFGLAAFDVVRSPSLVAAALCATSLGIVLPVLGDAGQTDGVVGRIVVTAGSIAEAVPILLLSGLFSTRATGVVAPVVLLVAFAVLVAAVASVLAGVEGTGRFTHALLALQDTSAEIRVRGTVALLMGFAALAARFGLEAILGAFLAGVTLTTVDRDESKTHALLRVKLKAIGFGVFVPFFFVSTGMTLDVRSLVDDPAVLARVPLFLVALILARAAPVVEGIILIAAERPPFQSLRLGPSTVFCVAV